MERKNVRLSRRQFLKVSAAAATGVFVGSVSTASFIIKAVTTSKPIDQTISYVRQRWWSTPLPFWHWLGALGCDRSVENV